MTDSTQTFLDVARRAEEALILVHERPVIRKQLATGVAVHFGEYALFVPGENPDKLRERVLQKVEELACAYAAWNYAAEREEYEKKEESHE